MNEFYALIEVAVTILGSVFWTFALYAVKPGWVVQKLRSRIVVSVIEGVICTLAWLLVLVVTSTPVTLESIEIAALCGVIWAVMATYTRGRYYSAKDSEATLPHRS